MYSIVPFQVIGISLSAALLTELLCWLLVYRHPKFNSLRADGEVLQVKLDELKAEGRDNDKDKTFKKISRQQEVLSMKMFGYNMAVMVSAHDQIACR